MECFVLDMGNATMIGSSFVEVLQAYTGEDIEVHGIVKDDIQLTELKDELETYLSKKPSLASRFAGWSILGIYLLILIFFSFLPPVFIYNESIDPK